MNHEELKDIIDELEKSDLEGDDTGMARFYVERAIEQLRLAVGELGEPEGSK